MQQLVVSVSFGARALFKWKGKSCPDSEASSCWLYHGGLLVMDGRCKDEFLHCMDPGLEQERMNVTFGWIKQHVASCPFLKTAVACCLPTCAQGSSVSVTEFVGYGAAWDSCCSLGPAHLGSTSSAGLILLCVGPELRRRAYRWTRPSEQRSAAALSSWFSRSSPDNASSCDRIWGSGKYCWTLLYLLVLMRLPSLHDYHACMVSWNKGALGGNCRQKQGKTSLSPSRVFVLCRSYLYRFWGVISWYLWIGRARHPGPDTQVCCG